MMTSIKDTTMVVDPALYSEEYYLSDNEGWAEYADGLDRKMHDKFAKALSLAKLSKNDTVLDIGCGRGELLYYCAKAGVRALGMDYSAAAIKIADNTISNLPGELSGLARAKIADPAEYDFADKYSVIFMIEILEHMHDWQLERLFRKISGLLTDNGRVIIITPNHYYEKYLSPIKMLLNLPVNVIKLPFRIFKQKYMKNGLTALLKKTFKVKVDRGDLNRAMHVNVTTPPRIRELLSGFDAAVRCEDASINPVSLIMKRWWGREIVAIAKNRAKIS